ncbi:MAG: hypothetical protein RMX63_08375 [Aulosira sp. ZfuCHP01]|nr:hypothetical protein [Aulosira sp. ZfuCHP01]
MIDDIKKVIVQQLNLQLEIANVLYFRRLFGDRVFIHIYHNA